MRRNSKAVLLVSLAIGISVCTLTSFILGQRVYVLTDKDASNVEPISTWTSSDSRATISHTASTPTDAYLQSRAQHKPHLTITNSKLHTNDSLQLAERQFAAGVITRAKSLCKLKSDPDHYWCHKDEETVDSLLNKPISGEISNSHQILFTIRTTMRYHKTRVNLLLDTWVSRLNATNYYIVTDGRDPELENKTKKLGMHYVDVGCGREYSRESLCCKSGEEIALLLRPEHKHFSWFCHVDDDVYLIVEQLIRILQQWDPSVEEIYFGRPGSKWKHPYQLKRSQKLIISEKKLRFHFAVGGMYCLSRPLIERARQYLGGKALAESCNKLLEPEDVTIGAIVELLMKTQLKRTWHFYSSGINLATVNPNQLHYQFLMPNFHPLWIPQGHDAV